MTYKITKISILFILLIFICFNTNTYAFEINSPQYKISSGVLSSADGSAQSPSYSLSILLGQTLTGKSNSGNYQLILGAQYYEADIDEYYCTNPPWTWMPTSKLGTDTIDNSPLDDLCCGDDANEYYIGSSETPLQTADNTDGCCPNPTDCVIFNDCFTSDTNMQDDGGRSCYNAGLFQGFCGDSKWQTTPDESKDACCCISNGYWDDIQRCCDTGDEWTSSDNKWVCTDGIVYGNYTGQTCDTTLAPLPTETIVTFECNEIEIDGIKTWWNGTQWVTLAPLYCGCTQNSDCDTINGETCIENMCLTILDQTLIFSNMKTIPFGNTEEYILEIINNMEVTDYIELKIKDTSSITKWTWFKGQKNMDPHHKIINIPPHTSKKIILNIFGGQTGVYTLDIDTQSFLTLNEKSIQSQINIINSINSISHTSTRQTPGLSGFSMLIILIIASSVLYTHKTK